MPLSVTDAPGRRERKKLETRRALASAALHLAVERGPDHVTIEDIAERADVSVRTFFNYFSSKEEAIVGWDPEGLAELVQELMDRPASELPFEAVRHVLRGIYETASEWADDRARRVRLVQEHPSLLPRHLANHYELERRLQRALAARLGVAPEDSLYAAVVVNAAVSAMRLALAWWEHHGRAVPLTQLVDEAFEVLGRGLTPPAAPRKK